MRDNNLVLSFKFVLVCWIAAAGFVSAQQVDGFDRDVARSIPQTMTVDAVDFQSRQVVLDGDIYQLLSGDDERPQPLSNSAHGDNLDLAALRPGMQVIVQTDGSDPSDENTPIILGIWKGD